MRTLHLHQCRDGYAGGDERLGGILQPHYREIRTDACRERPSGALQREVLERGGMKNWGAHELGGAYGTEGRDPAVRESAKVDAQRDEGCQAVCRRHVGQELTMPLLREAGPYLDYIAIHGYWDPLFHVNNPAPFLKCMMKTDAPEQDIQRTIGILDEAGFGAGKIKIAYDEWNLRNWHHPWHGDLRRGFDLEARRKNDMASTYTMADALFSACFLNACLRHSDVVDIACFAPVVNTRGLSSCIPTVS